MYPHRYRDPATGLRWNSLTNKFVVKVRESTKGATVGRTYTKRLKALGIKKANAWLPNGISKNYLKEVFDSLWEFDVDWNMDLVVATINTYYFNRYCRGYKNELKREDGFVYIPMQQFRDWVHDKHYTKYLDILNQAEILESKSFEYNPHDSNKVKYAYKINDKWIDKSQNQWYKVLYDNDRFNVKIHDIKQLRKKNVDSSDTRAVLAKWCEELVRELDYYGLKSALEKKVKRARKERISPWDEIKVKNNSLNDLKRITKDLVSGDSFYCNAKDESGHRFHSPFTNTNDYLQQFIKIDGSSVVQHDIVNSQMFFFSLCLEDISLVYPFLQGDDKDGKFRRALEQIALCKNNPDMVRFSKLCRSGKVYDNLSKLLGKRRNSVKDKLFKVLFSNIFQCETAKKQVLAVYPTLVHLANCLNDENLIPKMMQRLESYIMIDVLSSKLISSGIKFITCHDSIISKECESDMVLELMKNVFRELNLPEPIIKKK